MAGNKLNPTLTTIVAGLLLVLAYDGVRLYQDLQFNDALANSATFGAGAVNDPYRQFARAHTLQQRHDFKAAVEAYAAISARSGSRLQNDVTFNLANLYFQEALRLQQAGDDDLAMPLIELAKQNYREILRADSAHWDAKYNLELALLMAPETDPIDVLGERNPERSPRAISKMQSRQALP